MLQPLHMAGRGLMGALLVLMTTHALAKPAIFWASDPIVPGEVVVVAGHDLLQVSEVGVALIQGEASQPTQVGPLHTAEILQSSNHALKFVLPPALPPGEYRYTLSGKGAAISGDLNAPTIYWAQGDRGTHARAGGWIRVMGRNIQRHTSALLELVPARGDIRRIAATSGDLWEARFDLPASLAAGHYRLRLWNGGGGQEGWRDAGGIDIIPDSPASDLRVNVTSHGAAGDGVQDDTGPIQEALDTISRRGGGTVFIPRGYYKLSAPLTIPPHTVLRGAGKDATSLVWTDFDSPPPVLISGTSDFTVEDLTLTAARHFHFLRGGFPSADGARYGANITIARVRIQGSSYLGRLSVEEMSRRLQAQLDFSRTGADTLGLAGQNIVVENCEVYGSRRSLFLLHPKGARLANNVFYNGRRGWYSITGADGVLFEHNRIVGADMQASGGGINTLDRSTTYSQNVLFRSNRMENMFGWDREAMTTDGAGGFYYGTGAYSAKASAAHLTLDNPPSPHTRDRKWEGAGVFITGGKGHGQYRRVVRHEKSQVNLDAPFTEAPDSTSRYSIVSLQRHYLILDNTGTDTGATVQFYGTAVNHVFAGNKSVRTRGFEGMALFYKHFQPSWYIQFLENEITTPLPEKPSVLRLLGQTAKNSKDTLGYALLLRRNRLLGNSSIIIKSSKLAPAALSDILVENNFIKDTAIGISIEGTVNDYLVRGNQFSNVRTEVLETP